MTQRIKNLNASIENVSLESASLEDTSLESALIEPITVEQEQQVIKATADYIRRASRLYQHDFAQVPVVFDLKGRAAGMYIVSGRGKTITRKIRYNPWLFAKYYDENLRDTVPHEVAHGAAVGWRRKKVLPHGNEWRSVMAAFGADDSVTSSFDLSGIPCRQQKTILYHCQCREHQLGVRRHNKVQRNSATYSCRYCGERLVLS